jgi:diguanylate cyclase (GGDEF)-like protein
LSNDEDMEKILRFFSNNKSWGGPKKLFRNADKYIQSQFDGNHLVVISLPVLYNKTDGGKQQNRVFWNKAKYNKHYNLEVSSKIFDFIEKNKMSNEFGFKLKDLNYDFFLIGIKKKQKYFAFFTHKNESIKESIIYQHFKLFISNVFSQIEQLEKVEELNSLVHLDDVTGLYNQRKLQIDIDKLIEKYKETSESFSILFIDIDHFKSINDSHGHLVGTQILLDFSNVLKVSFRESDTIYRYGGDEFVILVPDADQDLGSKIAYRILEKAKKTVYKIPNSKSLKFTVSIGVATFPEDAKSSYDILEMADHVMYDAKLKGRGQVRLARELSEEKKK